MALIIVSGCASQIASRATPSGEQHGAEVMEWLDFSDRENMPWNDTLELEVPEFPNIVFTWRWDSITATDHNGEFVLFQGVPISQVFLADITGDGLPDFVATVSVGSGIVDNRVLVYDFVNNELYELSNRAVYNYSLLMDNGNLFVLQTPSSGAPWNGVPENSQKGELEIIDGKLAMINH